MKKIILLSGLIVLSFSSFAQNVVTESNGRVTVGRVPNGAFEKG